MSVLDEFQTGFVTSPDGTRIGYRAIGAGPALILVHGGLQSSLNFTTLAKALSTDFKVYVPDRRGRGLSSPYRRQDGLPDEAEDILSLINATGAAFIFALSSGAIVTLQAALLKPRLQKIALYEPPIVIHSTVVEDMMTRYEHAMHKGNPGRAFLTILKGTGDPGDKSILNILPAFIMAPLVNRMIKTQCRKNDPAELPLATLIPTFHYDCHILRNSLPLIDQATHINAEVLLMGGSKSQPYLATALDHLEKSFPQVTRITFEKSGHFAADNSENPLLIAGTLKRFFQKNN